MFAAMPTEAHGSSSAAVTAAGASAALPVIRAGAEELATNPKAWKAGKVIGEVVGGVAGMLKAGPLGAAGGMWVGGKAGWRLTNALQRVAAPIAKAAAAIEPYVKTAQPVIAAQGALDLAQMAEPERADIGVMGVGRTPSAQQTLASIERYERNHKGQPLPPQIQALKAKLMGSK